MTSIAKTLLAEPDAVALANALDDDERLASLPVSLGETTGGKWQVLVYLGEDDEDADVAAFRRISVRLLGKNAPKVTIEKLPDTDWVARSLEGLPPVRAGRFLVHGSHDRGACRANDIAIEIEAGQAFGTGHHGTTAGCLLAIDRIARSRPITTALDVGTGSGVLAIAIAKTAKAPVLASDIDPVAVRVARENIRLNGVAGYVHAVVAADLKGQACRMRAPYDLVVANILAGPLVALAPDICRKLAPGGTLILSGLLPIQRARIVAAYRGQGLALVRASVLDGWLTLVLRRAAHNPKGRSHRLRPS